MGGWLVARLLVACISEGETSEVAGGGLVWGSDVSVVVGGSDGWTPAFLMPGCGCEGLQLCGVAIESAPVTGPRLASRPVTGHPY